MAANIKSKYCSLCKQIPLTQGKFAIIDAEDYEELSKYKWYAMKTSDVDYMAVRNSHGPKRRLILMHRQVMNTPKGMDTDHRNHNRLDNRKSNLRICTTTQNLQNGSSQKGSTSQYKGVSWYKRDKKWRADIQVNGKKIFLGYFDNETEAAHAYDEAAVRYFDGFAKTNFSRSKKCSK